MCLLFSAYDEYEVSPYEELQLNLVRNIEMSRMASIMAGREFSFQIKCRPEFSFPGLHFSIFFPELPQLPLYLWTGKTSVWRQLRTAACMRNAAPCGQNMSWPAPSEQQPLTTAVTARNATKPCGASWSVCQRSTALLCSSVPALTLCAGSAGGKPSSHRVPMRRAQGGRRGWASPTASACRTTAPEMSCVGKMAVWVSSP